MGQVMKVTRRAVGFSTASWIAPATIRESKNVTSVRRKDRPMAEDLMAERLLISVWLPQNTETAIRFGGFAEHRARADPTRQTPAIHDQTLSDGRTLHRSFVR